MPAGPSRSKLLKGVDTTKTESSEVLQAKEIMHKDTLASGIQQRLDLDALYESVQKPLQILVCGKAGVGKSTLINSFFGCTVVEANDPGLEGGHMSSGTTKVESCKLQLGKIPVDLFDSPGMENDEGPNVMKEYLQGIYENCKGVDLFLYCFDMTSNRFTTADIKTLETFNKQFGESFWKRCVLVLTKANLVRIPRKEKGKEREYHQRRYQTMLSKFREELGKLGVGDSVRNAIPACAAGLAYEDGAAVTEERFIWYPSDKAEPSDQPVDFLGELWLTCIEKVPAGPSRDKLLNCNDTIYTKKPIRESKEVLGKEVLRAKEEYERRERERQQERRELERQWERRDRELERRDWELERRDREWEIRECEREQAVEHARKEIHYKKRELELTAKQYKRQTKVIKEQSSFFKFVVKGALVGAAIGGGFGPVQIVVGGVIGGTAGAAVSIASKFLENHSTKE